MLVASQDVYMISGLQPICALLGFSPIKALLQAEWLGRHCHSAPEALCLCWSLGDFDVSTVVP